MAMSGSRENHGARSQSGRREMTWTHEVGCATPKVGLEAERFAHVAVVSPRVRVLFCRRDEVHSLQVRMRPPGGHGDRAPTATLRKILQDCRQNHALLSLKFLYPGGGRKIPAIWHGAGAYPGVFIPET